MSSFIKDGKSVGLRNAVVGIISSEFIKLSAVHRITSRAEELARYYNYLALVYIEQTKHRIKNHLKLLGIMLIMLISLALMPEDGANVGCLHSYSYKPYCLVIKLAAYSPIRKARSADSSGHKTDLAIKGFNERLGKRSGKSYACVRLIGMYRLFHLDPDVVAHHKDPIVADGLNLVLIASACHIRLTEKNNRLPSYFSFVSAMLRVADLIVVIVIYVSNSSRHSAAFGIANSVAIMIVDVLIDLSYLLAYVTNSIATVIINVHDLSRSTATLNVADSVAGVVVNVGSFSHLSANVALGVAIIVINVGYVPRGTAPRIIAGGIAIVIVNVRHYALINKRAGRKENKRRKDQGSK